MSIFDDNKEFQKRIWICDGKSHYITDYQYNPISSRENIYSYFSPISIAGVNENNTLLIEAFAFNSNNSDELVRFYTGKFDFTKAHTKRNIFFKGSNKEYVKIHGNITVNEKILCYLFSNLYIPATFKPVKIIKINNIFCEKDYNIIQKTIFNILYNKIKMDYID